MLLTIFFCQPENILLDAEGHVRLTDFGLSKVKAALASESDLALSAWLSLMFCISGLHNKQSHHQHFLRHPAVSFTRSYSGHLNICMLHVEFIFLFLCPLVILLMVHPLCFVGAKLRRLSGLVELGYPNFFFF